MNLPHISIIIPNYNGSATIGKCLEAAFALDYENFEVVVVDDCSTDNSVEIIRSYPCELVRLEKHGGASKSRNVGARNSRGELLFFVDADCLLPQNCLNVVARCAAEYGPETIIGGSYTWLPYDVDFFSMFQSAFIRYCETRHLHDPDYIATHAMVINAGVFERSGGFPEEFMPILEDVEFSHRMRRAAYRLVMAPDLLVQHIFKFNLLKSVRNAIRKASYWTTYSLRNQDLLKDSGTASVGLKVNVVACYLVVSLLFAWGVWSMPFLLIPLPLIVLGNIFINRGLLKAFHETEGSGFAFRAGLYYTSLYALTVGAGAMSGTVRYFLSDRFR